jgi:hypothetical protein
VHTGPHGPHKCDRWHRRRLRDPRCRLCDVARYELKFGRLSGVVPTLPSVRAAYLTALALGRTDARCTVLLGSDADAPLKLVRV